MRSTLNLRMLTPADWSTLKAVRLDALEDSPHAFMSRLEDEQRMTESQWRGTFERASWIVAEETTGVIGLTRSVREQHQSPVCHLESIWVATAPSAPGLSRVQC